MRMNPTNCVQPTKRKEKMIISEQNRAPEETLKFSRRKLENTTTTTTSNDFADDVLIDILRRLPVKTLIRLRCVSKSWFSTITHPVFITTHLFNRPCSYDDDDDHAYLQYIKFGSCGKQIWCLLSEQKFVNHVELEIPFHCSSSNFQYFKFVNSYNGVVCLSDSLNFGRTIFLWNPSIRKFKTLPCRFSTFCDKLSDSNNYVILGFGFHHQTNDYKVVRILYFRDVNWNYIEEESPQVEVYSLSTDTWKRIEDDVPCFLSVRLSNAFVNGSVHWADDSSETIMSFNFDDEEFGEIMLPDYYMVGLGTSNLLLAVSKESLSLCVYFPGSGHCYTWVMTEYGVDESWTKQFTVVLPHGIISRSLGFIKYNKLLLEMTDRQLASYDLETLQLNYLGIRGTGYTSNAVYYMETLVLLK